ncbi:ADP-ribosylation factor [Entamoeba marina]
MGNTIPPLFGIRNKKALIVGLDQVGKTSTLYRLTNEELISITPNNETIAKTINLKNIQLALWDINLNHCLKPLWKYYYKNTDCIIFILDSSNQDGFNEEIELLSILLQDELLKDAILLIYSNKQDLPNALPTEIVVDGLNLNEIKNRKWFCQPSCTITGEGLLEGMDWIYEQFK